MKPKSKLEFTYWAKYHGHENDDRMYNYEKYKGNDYKKRKRRYYKSLRRVGKIIIEKELLLKKENDIIKRLSTWILS
jgi:hypothetical protein